MSAAETGRRLYEVEFRIRRFEETVARLFAEGKLPGFVHLSIGQEAVAAGACAALEEGDVIVSNHRGHGHCIAKGGDVRRMMAELFGSSDGYCRGVAGSMHIADLGRGILGANGIVGAGIGIATGAALSFKTRNEDRVALVFFGDGAINEGLFHEALNLAALWSLPVVFLCENNGYAELTPASVHTAGPGVKARAAAYGVAAEGADGIDALEVMDVVASAVARCRSGSGPALVEARTHRWHGHFEGDQQGYRSKEELTAMREHDPLVHLRERILREGWADDPWFESVQSAVADEVEEAVRAAAAGRSLEFAQMLELAGEAANG